ncbi:hypothetical protein Poli38472_001601 [Pythium oligandrum]|uniref:Uncharacterized protein n=1 Tax=Pythium oligandrum TaxID=41045 RepID=A0A8K1CTR7_PYTOL|nr:hypothetical protein Poli38472_001601 [Pythium oligandrum]|eukprot:TMW69445.1 hypothetical protein Poli38472_001601 [Pythium oligandrum]
MTQTESNTVPQVSAHFPRVPADCKKVADKFFSCFYEHGKQDKDSTDPEAGNKALVQCASAVQAYNQCVDVAVKKAPKKLFRVPEAYRVRDE